jgi:acetyl esterase/lipase
MKHPALFLIGFALLLSPVGAEPPPPPAIATAAEQLTDVVYGRKFGVALTMDVFRPKENANGAGVIWVVSGGWVSSHGTINTRAPFSPVPLLLQRGYTVFAVVHGCQPKFSIPEIVADMNRAVRFIRHHAADYQIDPQRIGVTGGSAGGHLSTMLGTAGKEGDAQAKDPIDRVSSRVQAVACFYPPTDFLNYGKPGEDAIGRGVLKDYWPAFAFTEFDPKAARAGALIPVTDEARIIEMGKQISPITHVSAESAPTLIIHGDKDLLVPMQQAQTFLAKLKEAGVPGELVVKEGAAHGWPGLEKDMPTIVDWFDKHLAKK